MLSRTGTRSDAQKRQSPAATTIGRRSAPAETATHGNDQIVRESGTVDQASLREGGTKPIPLSAAEHRALRTEAGRPTGLVFPSRANVTQPVSLRTPWETALKRIGIEAFRWHDLRYSAASILPKGGASLLEIGALLGHKSANTTKRYAHLTEQHTADLVRGLGARLPGN